MKIGLEQNAKGWTATLYDDRREYLNTGGATAKEAISWLVRAVNRVAMKTGDMVIEMGLLSDADVDSIVYALDDELHGKAPAEIMVVK